MNTGYIAVMDSGIGGLFTLKRLIEEMPNERFLYFGDNLNAPYGDKPVSLLNILTLKNVSRVMTHGVKALVFACNTLAVNVLGNVKRLVPVPVFGVYPPTEKTATEGKRTVLFCTERTAERFNDTEQLKVVSLSRLAKDVEKNAADLSAVNLKAHLDSSLKYRKIISENYRFDTVILGCTHYGLIKNKFSDHFCPRNIISGDDFTAKQVKKALLFSGKLANNKEITVDFIGDCAEKNRKIFLQVVKAP